MVFEPPPHTAEPAAEQPASEPAGQRAERRLVQLEGEAAPQLAELILLGWVVLERQGTSWLLERLPAPVRLPTSWPRPAFLARPARPPTLAPASVRTAPLSRH